MRVLTILYHDVVRENFDASGFPGAAAARYKFTEKEFADHARELASNTPSPFVTVDSIELQSHEPAPSRLLTFDDGGASALTIADTIEEHGWRGHFFITTDYLNTPAFLTPAQVRDLHERGHVIGSHSCSHPFRIADLPPEALDREWTESTAKLSDLLGDAVTTASVPGGFYAPCVAESAAAAGIQHLFTSEPTMKVATVAGCRILGRYSIHQGVSARAAGNIVAGKRLALARQKLVWDLKKTLKTVARPIWDGARKLYFGRRPDAAQSHADDSTGKP